MTQKLIFGQNVFGGFDPNSAKRTSQDRGKSRKENRMKKWRIILRNLPFEFDPVELRKNLEQHGTVVELNIPQTAAGKPRGFAFVQYMQFADAHKAKHSLNGATLFSREVTAEYTMPKDAFEAKRMEGRDREILARFSETKKETAKSDSASKRHEGTSTDGANSDDEDEKGSSSESGSETESETDSEDDDNQAKHSSNDCAKPSPTSRSSSDVGEGKTLFVRNVPFEATEDDLRSCFAVYGSLRYALLCRVKGSSKDDPHRGTAFIQFTEKSDAEKCVAESSTSSLSLMGRTLNVSLALSRNDVAQINSKAPKDNRNLHLLDAGHIRTDSAVWKRMSQSDQSLRERIQIANRQKLKRDLHVFVSQTRLCVHNLSRRVDDKNLESICYSLLRDQPGARIVECRIMRDMQQVNARGIGRSRGFAFVDFTEHKHALLCLQRLNNNAAAVGSPDAKRPIVEFALENRAVHNLKAQRRQKAEVGLKRKRSTIDSDANFETEQIRKKNAARMKRPVSVDERQKTQRKEKAVKQKTKTEVKLKTTAGSVDALKATKKHKHSETRDTHVSQLTDAKKSKLAKRKKDLERKRRIRMKAKKCKKQSGEKSLD